MIYSVRASILLIVLLDLTSTYIRGDPYGRGSDIIGDSGSKRLKRWTTWITVLGQILKESTIMFSKNNYSWYFKTGGVKQAREDFEALKPYVLFKDDNNAIGKASGFEVQFRRLYQERLKAEVSLRSLEKMPDGTNRFMERVVVYGDGPEP